MAVAFGTATENVAAASPQAFTHTPAGTPRGVRVYLAHEVTTADIVSGVTYGGVAMTRTTTVVRTAIESGRAYVYELGAGIPTGAKTVSITRTEGTTVIWAVAITVTAGADTETVDFEAVGASGNITNPSVTLQYGGRLCLGLFGGWAATNATTGLTDNAGQTRLHDHDFGNSVALVSRKTTPGTSDATLGWNAPNAPMALIGVAISEVVSVSPRRARVTWAELEVPDVPATPAPSPRPPFATDLSHVELWTDVQANGGRLLAPVARWLGLTEHTSLGGEHTVTLTLPFDHPVARLSETPVDDENLRIDQVLRLLKDDGTWTEHRVSETTRSHQGGERTRTLIARSIMQDLAFRGLVTRTTADGSRTADFEALSLPMADHITAFILPALREAGAPFWQLGTMAHVFPVDMVYAGDTPMSALRKLVEVGSASLASGTLELDTEAGASQYLIHLVEQIGAALPLLQVRARRNLIDLGLTERADDQATRVYVVGASVEDGRQPTPGQATWAVTSRTIGVDYIDLVLADPRGGEGPIKYDGQFLAPDLFVDDPDTEEIEVVAPFYLDYLTGGDFFAPIVATTAATQTVRVALVGTPPPLIEISSGFDSGTGTFPELGFQRVRIVADALKTENVFLDHPAMVAKYGVRVGTLDRPDLPGTENLVSNAVARDWPPTSPLPTGWKNPLPTLALVARETSPRYWEHGGQAVRVRWPDGASDAAIQFPRILLPHRAQGFLSFFLRVTTLVGRVRVGLDLLRRATDLAGNPSLSLPYVSGTSLGYRIPDFSGMLVNDTVLPSVTNIELNTAEEIGIAAAWDLSKYPLYGGEASLFIAPSFDQIPGTECVISGGQVTLTSSQMPLLEGSGGIRLHQAANARLGIYAAPAPTVSVNLIDLAFLQGRRIPADLILQKGQPIQIDDPDLDVSVQTRVVGWTRDWHQRVTPSVEVSNERADIVALLAAHARSPRHATTLAPAGTRGLTYAP